MKKIVVAFDGLTFSEPSMHYAAALASAANAHLVGVFLEDFTHHSYKIYELVSEKGVSSAKLKELERKDKATRAEAVARFETFCNKSAIKYSVHRDHFIAIRDLVHETIYADMLVISRDESFSHYADNKPSPFIKELMINMQCPALLVPSKYKPLKKIVLLYDGKPASVYAVKMFSYLFDSLKNLPAEVISVKSAEDNMHLPDNRLMKEFMKRHFPKAAYTVLQGFPEHEIINHLKEQQEAETLIVAGAYRRGSVSRWFRASMGDVLMKELKSPLFIAHQ